MENSLLFFLKVKKFKQEPDWISTSDFVRDMDYLITNHMKWILLPLLIQLQ